MARVFGNIAGQPEGRRYVSRREAHEAGVHKPLQAGISGASAEGADSIVVSGGYEDDQDFGDTIVYTGHGGNDPATGVQVADQVLERGNAALAFNHRRGLPVRVIRGAGGDPTISPETGYRYDGLFDVDDYWEETGRSGFRIWRFRLVKRATSGRGSDGPSTGAGVRRPATGTSPRPSEPGTTYVPAVPTVAADGGEPFEVDPDKLDRATRAHAELQNFLAERLEALGLKPLSPALPHDPEFDIAWRHDGRLHVCEVKTTTSANRDRQLRLALGQVLHYAKQLEQRGETVRTLVLTPGSPPETGDIWSSVMDGVGVGWITREMIAGDDVAARAAILRGI
ncbi:YDG/SRA domain-containing protein [Solirubrobacter ginsenosidimutans]|uniref:YDG/SRA domain-containing protein n=1 Tax=Solirubrobacter ginsenosidimutans TaxID=490573 RepID=A0A9X3S4J3_9ACTN|nr:YDG/SRA domain-containing protein [Solirubrobacter ginsenosidimutans]MDA0160648.1 YDG/SRA domain-containing protein [Solirubrobacter ginsenosidimutans]